MEPINRGKGTTDSERYLAQLADKTFLELWSYPNSFIDKRNGRLGTGKEFCDLLVVCGNDIIIFSDKSVTWPASPDINLSWARWYRRAISKSVDQIRGAERWLRDYPNRIFIDPHCTQKLPVPLAAPERRQIHGIAIALGAEEACKRHYGDRDGSIILLPSLKGAAHIDPKRTEYMPFAIGDVDPLGPFVHVFDKVGLDLVMSELDTITDFVQYLQARQQVIRHEKLLYSPNEAELLSIYLKTVDERGRHSFPLPEVLGGDPDHQLLLAEGMYRELISHAAYKAKKTANETSYIWDQLIRLFTDNIIAGTSVGIMGELPTAALAEPGLRVMAREDRTIRRALGSAFASALSEAERQKQDRFARVILPNRAFGDPEAVAYVFLILAYPTGIQLKKGYQQYRNTRVAMLLTYCQAVLYEHRTLKRAIGIALDASSRVTGRQGGSEDLVMFEVSEWTPDLEREVEERRSRYDVLVPERIRVGRYSMQEYPELPEQLPSRQQRRAMARQLKKQNRPGRGA
jgi:hypothetical protein